MKRPVHCGEQPLGCKTEWTYDIHVWQSQHMNYYLPCAAPSTITKYCTCHEKSFSWLILTRYEIWNVIYNARSNRRISPNTAPARKKSLMIDPGHIWKVIYIARSNRRDLPTSPNTVPGTKNEIPKSERNLLKTAEASFAAPTIIRAWSERKPVSPQSAANWGCFRAQRAHFVLKNTRFGAPATIPNFTKCTCHEKW